jgi:DNA-binding Lrp family transcriptional regulator
VASTTVPSGAAPCWRRVRALEESGVIKGYRAEIDRQKVGLDVLAFVRLDAERNRGDVTRQLEEAIRKIPDKQPRLTPFYIASAKIDPFSSRLTLRATSTSFLIRSLNHLTSIR